MIRRNQCALGGFLIIALAMTGCVPSFLATAAQPTPALEEIDTVVVQTAAVAQTKTAMFVQPTSTITDTPTPTRVPTDTATPSPTRILFIPSPSLSPEPTLSPADLTNTGDNGDDGNGDDENEKPKRVREWSCYVISKNPPDGTVILAGAQFEVSWTIINTGTKTWPKKGVDVVFDFGARLHERAYYDIPTAVSPGRTVKIVVPLTVPKYKKGTYRTTWALRVGHRNFCPMHFTFEVK